LADFTGFTEPVLLLLAIGFCDQWDFEAGVGTFLDGKTSDRIVKRLRDYENVLGEALAEGAQLVLLLVWY